VPFVRFSRDKRGYEHVYLVQASGNRRGKPSPPRVLYWFRTPPDVKVGRAPFDETTRRVLEAQFPNLIFDWAKITSTPMPPPEPEPWRERRRAERLARHARAVEARDSDVADAEPMDVEGMVDLSPGPGLSAQPSVDDADGVAGTGSIVPDAEGSTAVAAPADAVASAARRRRRHRGGRGRSRPQPTAAAASPDARDARDVPDAPGRSTLDPHEEG
jgi:hypothetical protein